MQYQKGLLGGPNPTVKVAHTSTLVFEGFNSWNRQVSAANEQKIQATLHLLGNIHESVRSLSADPPAVKAAFDGNVNAARLKAHLLRQVSETRQAEADGHVTGPVANAVDKVATPSHVPSTSRPPLLL